jgi:hypothetical protein
MMQVQLQEGMVSGESLRETQERMLVSVQESFKSEKKYKNK